MAKQTINIGAAPNDGTGTPLRTSFDYTNQNFTELYNALGGGVGLPGATNQVIFNNGTNLAGDGGLIYSSATDALTAGSFNPTASAIPTNGIYLPSSKNIGIAVDGVNVLNIDGIASRVTTTGSATITGDLTVDTSTLKVDSTNNRVGIGTASPARPLDIVGSFQSSLGWVLTGTPAGLGAATRYIGGASTTDSWYYNGVTGGSHIWAFGESTAMTLNSTGLGVGGSPIASHFISAYGPICVTGTAGGTRTSYISNANTGSIYYTDGGASYPFDNFGNLIIQPRTSAARSVIIATGSTTPVERLIVDPSGNLLVGTTSGTSHNLRKQGTTVEGDTHLNVGNAEHLFFACSSVTYNAAAAAYKITRNSSTLRSINAGGTINASGADYAEYMVKCGDFVLAKGDVAGIDANGKLTNVFADAISFVVKSTDPSYVGNDKWGVDLEGDALETARQLVDRIAFAGQVPVNVTGATAGDYIVPVVDGTGIKGISVSNPTFEQYKLAVGKVIAIDADGRARIIVKVA
jgi:hypothetical protein